MLEQNLERLLGGMLMKDEECECATACARVKENEKERNVRATRREV
jgi:hypothetical protein